MSRRPHHTWQAARGAAALDPAGALPDPRSDVDMIRYIADVAGLIRFSDRAGPGNATWAGFLDTDPVFLMAEIACHLKDNTWYDSRGDTGEALEEISDDLQAKLRRWQTRAGKSGHQRLTDAIEAALDAAPEPPPLPEAPMLFTSVDGPAPPDLSDVLQIVSPFDRAIRSLGAEVAEMLHRSLNTRRDHPPHIGLILAFLDMRKEVVAHMNGFTAAHLDFYYRGVLGLTPRPAHRDTAVVALTPVADAAPFDVPAGTVLEAGRTAEGLPVHYATDAAVRLGPAKITRLMSLAVRTDGDGRIRQVVQDDMALPLAGSFAPFGAPGTGTAAQTGIVITSPALQLPGGRRRITVTLDLAGETSAVMNALNGGEKDAAALGLEVSLATGNGPFYPTQCRLRRHDDRDDVLDSDIVLSPEDPAITEAPDPEGRSGGGRMDLTLIATSRGHGAAWFSGCAVRAATVTAQVTEMTPASVMTPAGKTETASAFAPLGPQPSTDAALMFSLPAGDRVAVSDASVTLHWTGLPEGRNGFGTWYHGYRPPPGNQDFRVAVEARDGAGWRVATDDLPLFDMVGDALAQTTVLALPDRRTGADAAFRVRLTAPRGGFGRDRFPAEFARAAIDKNRWGPRLGKQLKAVADKLRSALGAAPADPEPEMPNPPFTPMAERISLSYTATARSGADAGTTGGLWAKTPFGLCAGNTRGPVRFADLPGPQNGTCPGTLCMGIESYSRGERLDFFLDIAAPQGGPRGPVAGAEGNRLNWCYLTDNGWRTLPPENIPRDDTAALSQSGLLRVRLPEDASDTAPDMPGGLHWLSLSLTRDRDQDASGRVRGVLTGAVTATRQTGAPWDNAPPMQIKRVTGTALAPRIRRVDQPFAASGGRPAEAESGFRTRVSERLRHKSRAVQARDFEQIVLEAFPEVGEARAVRVAPGRVGLALCARRSEEVPLPQIAPHRLQEIALHLQRRTPAGAEITAENVRFEPVQVRAWVRYNQSLNRSVLNDVWRAIDAWIAPWLTDPDAPCPIGTGRLDPLALQAVLEGLDGAGYVTGLSLSRLGVPGRPGEAQKAPAFHDVASAPAGDTAAARVLLPGTPFSALVPAQTHILHSLAGTHDLGGMEVGRSFVVGRDGSDPEAPVFVRPAPPGIGARRIGTDFVPSADPRATRAAMDETS